MRGSLYCMHVPWFMCPTSYKGGHVSGFKSKSGATLILEAVAEYFHLPLSNSPIRPERNVGRSNTNGGGTVRS